jgi:hypothetical protein
MLTAGVRRACMARLIGGFRAIVKATDIDRTAIDPLP